MLLSYIEEIAKASGSYKLEALAKHPELKKIVEAAYNPFKKYYMTAPEVKGQGFHVLDDYPDLLSDLSSRQLTGNEALEAVSDAMTAMTPDNAEILRLIINKDLRCGINTKSISKVWPGLIPTAHSGLTKPPVMLLKTYDPKKAKFPCLAAVKRDGVRGLWSQNNLMSRQGKPFIGLDHITEQLKYFPHDLDGELCIDDEIFDIASGMIRNSKPTPNVVYHVFDMPSFPGNFIQRRLKLQKLLTESDTVKLIPVFKINTEESLIDFFRRATSWGEEGIVIYDPHSMYEDKRSYDWTRLVPLKTADCPVVGFFEGKGKHAGSLGGIIVNYKGNEVNVGTGFSEKILKTQLKQLVSQSDKTLLSANNMKASSTILHEISPIWHKIRDFIWANKDLFIGAVAECEFKEETKAGSMRQPRFKRWRWDKNE